MGNEETCTQLIDIIWDHLAQRDWDHPTERELAISISLEASELLEHYQWSETAVGDHEALAEELADVLIYALQYAHVLGVNPAAIIQDKLAKAARKYPAENFKGKSASERQEQWMKAKITHREHKKSL
jgi:NTP pyrophosphatase (non-canonical NTP hydrolase)